MAGILQLILAVRPTTDLQGGRMIVWLVALSCLWAVMRSVPRESVGRDFKQPGFSVVVKVGDLFAEQSGLIIGFTDVFDTSTEDGDIISPRSVQGQFLEKVFHGDTAALDEALRGALSGSPVLESESEASKPRGKRDRYPLGTVAVIAGGEFKYYGVAYSRMSNDLVAQSSVDYLWRSLDNAWSTLSSNGHLEPVAIPVLGSDLAKVGSLGRESLIKMIVLSFVARSRVSLVSRKLTVVVQRSDFDEVDFNEVQAFISSL
ncbi:macro domain-containing protein [Streptomyces sp. ID05-04B]|uniref:macro domain-containing protein n=1 Tax=Streptomyces sp. ID05-04B TaxID=3028661 RepID=UPI0029C9BD8F|nr:macro domain-containing protein [Streptomyces sp. ID05-04B]